MPLVIFIPRKGKIINAAINMEVSGWSEESECGLKSGHGRRWIGIILLGFIISLGFLKPVQQYLDIPKQITMFQGQQKALSSSAHESDVDSKSEHPAVASADPKHPLMMKGKKSGKSQVALAKNHIPLKKVNVNVLPDLRVIPGGQSIGVQLDSVGVLVVGYHLVKTKNGEKSPGEKAEIKIGDIITNINDKKIEEMSDVGGLVKKAGKQHQSLDVTLKRDKKKLHKKLTPLKDKEGDYQIGLYIRDSAAGIGTLTFYNPKSMTYGALGHVISDQDTKDPIVVNDGKVMPSDVTSIHKGDNGSPGEKIAKIAKQHSPLGSVQKNSPFGIFGKLNHRPDNKLTNKSIPIGLSGEVKEGPAKIYTVVDGKKVEAFDIKIVSSVSQKFPTTKGLVLKVTDPKLLKKTGGIVQGMSGSPIIQDGKLIGAVTHVFVNDSKTGYGVHIEWMLDEAGYDIFKDEDKKQEAS